MVRVVKKNGIVEDVCVDSCPVGAIIRSPDNKETIINPSKCIDCGICQSLCKTDAITESDEADTEDISYNETKAEEWDA